MFSLRGSSAHTTTDDGQELCLRAVRSRDLPARFSCRVDSVDTVEEVNSSEEDSPREDEDAATLLSLDENALFVLCGSLDDKSVCALRRVCHTLRASLSTDDADLGVWKPRVLATLLEAGSRGVKLWRPEAVGESPLVAAGLGGHSYEVRHAFLRRHIEFVGMYIWPKSGPAIGGAVRVRLLAGDRLEAALTLRSSCEMGSPYSVAPLFTVQMRPGDVNAGRRNHEKVTLHGGGVIPGDLRLNGDFVNLVMPLERGLGLFSYPRRHELFQRLDHLHGPGQALMDIGLRHPVFYGSYGPHGVELLHAAWGKLDCMPAADPLLNGETHGLNGVKLCGDKNVVSGQISFAAFGDLLTCREVEPYTCQCMWRCECIQKDELEVNGGGVTILGAMKAVARTAMHGNRNPCDNPAKLVFYKVKRPPPLPNELRMAGRPCGGEAVHMLLVWNGTQFRSSTRLAPVDLLWPGEVNAHIDDLLWPAEEEVEAAEEEEVAAAGEGEEGDASSAQHQPPHIPAQPPPGWEGDDEADDDMDVEDEHLDHEEAAAAAPAHAAVAV